MNIGDIVDGLTAGVGIDLSPDEKTAYIVEWSSGELSKVELETGKIETISKNLKFPEDVETDWKKNEIFISERTGEISKTVKKENIKITNVEGAPQQLALVEESGKRYLYTVCYDSGHFVCIDVDSTQVPNFTIIKSDLGHPVGLVIDQEHKYAYITEQDHNSLTKVAIKNGKSKIIYKGLISPFFLAWDRDYKGIFCVQRDPANSLVKLNLDSGGVNLEEIAEGLAFRPSGVAPNSDNDKIYICADQKLQVISFNGIPSIKPEPAPFEVHSIQFCFDSSNAIKLKDHVTNDFIYLDPEWIKNTRNEPAAYVRGTKAKIKVVFKQTAAYTNENYAIWAIGNHGGLKKQYITPTFNTTGLSKPIFFDLMWPLPYEIGKHTVTFEWFARKTAKPSTSIPIDSTKHTICTTWKEMVPNPGESLQNWVYKQPMLWTSEWAAGQDNEKAICDAIIKNLHLSGLKYGIGGWTVLEILKNGGGMCGGWYETFQHFTHCQGVFVHRRAYIVDQRALPNNEIKWNSIVIKAGGLNQSKPTWPPTQFNDVDSGYPITPSTNYKTVTEKRYIFPSACIDHDGHCINFLVYNGELYLYDPSFGTGPFKIEPFTGADAPLPPKDYSIIGGMELASFKKEYLDKAVDYMRGSLKDGSGTLKKCPDALTIKTSIIPNLTGSFQEITFKWEP